MAARRRSFHLNINAGSAVAQHAPRPGVLNPQRMEAQAGVLTIGLLAFARQASAFAFTLLGGCAPGVRPKTKREPRALLAGGPRVTDGLKMLAEAETTGTGTAKSGSERSGQEKEEEAVQSEETAEPEIESELDIADVGTGGADLEPNVVEPQAQTRGNNVLSSASEISEHAYIPVSLAADPPMTLTEKTAAMIKLQVKATPATIAPPIGIGLGLLIPSASTSKLRLLSPLESRCASPKPEFEPVLTHRPRASSPPNAELRANLVSKVAAFTAARLSGSRHPSPPHAASPPHPAYLDDPFSESCAATPPASFVPAHPARLCYPSLQFDSGQQQSPTPHPRPGRPSLRQRTVYFAQVSPRAGTPPPAFWSPHPAGSRSCAIPIKAPPTSRPVVEDKENQAPKSQNRGSSAEFKSPGFSLDISTRGRHRRGISHVFDTI